MYLNRSSSYLDSVNFESDCLLCISSVKGNNLFPSYSLSPKLTISSILYPLLSRSNKIKPLELQNQMQAFFCSACMREQN